MTFYMYRVVRSGQFKACIRPAPETQVCYGYDGDCDGYDGEKMFYIHDVSFESLHDYFLSEANHFVEVLKLLYRVSHYALSDGSYARDDFSGFTS